MRKIGYPVVAGTIVVLLLAGAGIASASGQFGSKANDDAMGNRSGGMDSMMGDGMMSGGMMGSFDEDKPFDLQFIDQMTMHHEGAIMSSEHMISDSKRPELRELAEDIEESQSTQIDQMQEWRDEWYPDAEQTSGMPAGAMDEMMGGNATDEMFLRMMIPHHQMAVDMSEKAIEEADHPEIENLARKIIDEQKAEIELMEDSLEEIEAASKG